MEVAQLDITIFYKAFQESSDKVGYLKELRNNEHLQNYDINWDTLIEAWSYDNWPQRHPRVRSYN